MGRDEWNALAEIHSSHFRRGSPIMEMDMSQLSENHARVQYEVTISELHEYVLWKAILILKL